MRPHAIELQGLQGPIEVMLEMGKKIVLNKGSCTDKELAAIIGQKMKS